MSITLADKIKLAIKALENRDYDFFKSGIEFQEESRIKSDIEFQKDGRVKIATVKIVILFSLIEEFKKLLTQIRVFEETISTDNELINLNFSEQYNHVLNRTVEFSIKEK